MSFEITPVHGTVEELGSDLAAPPLHEREEFVVEEVKKAIYHVVSALGGYLSVSCSGNINPVAGETGDVVQIYITSLPQPDSAPVETPIATASGIETGEPAQQETALNEEAPVNTEITTQPVPPATQENQIEEVPATSLSEAAPKAVALQEESESGAIAPVENA